MLIIVIIRYQTAVCVVDMVGMGKCAHGSHVREGKNLKSETKLEQLIIKKK